MGTQGGIEWNAWFDVVSLKHRIRQAHQDVDRHSFVHGTLR